MKKLNKIIAAACTGLAVLLAASCQTIPGDEKSDASKTENGGAASTQTESNHPLGISDADYQKILEKSIYSPGNNYRLKKVIEKMRNGEKVTYAALGGSVTEGAGAANFKDGYAYQFGKLLREKYTPDGGKNFYTDVAGLSGTPSPLGLVRYQSDVVDVLGQNPDILIIEFSVNDGGECTGTRAFEALIRNALEANPETCVIALYSDAKTYKNVLWAMIPVASFYRIPQVSIQDAIESSGVKVDENKFFDDYVHPKKEGHTIMAECLMYLFEKADAAQLNDAYEIPAETYKNKPLTNFTRILGDDENVKITKGGFGSVDANCQSIKKTGKSDFPFNWHHGAEDGNEPFVMKINCKELLFVYKEQGSWLSEKFGKAQIFVDGQLKMSCDGGKAGGWNNCVISQLIDEETASEHTVEIKMADGETAKGFTIVAMGYSK